MKVSAYVACIVFAIVFPLLAAAQYEGEIASVKIGVLAKRGPEQALKMWLPTAQFLSERIPETSFEIVPLDFADIYGFVEQGKVDFVLANSSFYVELELLYGANRIATLKNRRLNSGYTRFGGVIFRKADRVDIQTFRDLKGKVFMAVEETSFGGWRMAWRELKETGIDPYDDFRELRFGNTHDAVVYAVRDGKVDAGTVRTDTLERMHAEGKITLQDFYVIPRLGGADEDFPFLQSTRLYPEWPMAKVKHTPDELAEQVSIALLQMPPDSPAAMAAKSVGWTIPLNYQSVRECLKELKLGPYRDLGKIKLWDVLRKYWRWIFVFALLFVAMAVASLVILRLNRNIKTSHAKLQSEVAERQAAEEALRASEEKSRLLLESVGEGIFGVDAQGRCTFANPTAMKLLGYSNEELIGQNIHATIHHTHEDGTPYPMENCPMSKSFTEGTAHRIADEVLWRKDGTHFPVEYASTPMEKDDSLVGAVITFRDITERKAAEERFSALLESAPDAMIVSDETGTIVLVNSQAEVLFGYSREELIGKKIDMLVPEDIREVHPGYRAKFYADPKRLSMGFRSDFYGIAKDGRKIPMDIGLSPIETAEGLLVVASARDIRERIEAEAALRESEKRLQSILDTSPVGVAFSTKGKIQFANPRFKEMFGVGAGDSSPDLYVHPKERDVLVTKLTTEGKVEGYEIQLYNRDHEVREFLITYLPITFDDEEGILGWLLDITDRKNAEKEIKEKFDELTRFRRLAVGREKMMIELKKEINELGAQLGLDQMYKIVP